MCWSASVPDHVTCISFQATEKSPWLPSLDYTGSDYHSNEIQNFDWKLFGLPKLIPMEVIIPKPNPVSELGWKPINDPHYWLWCPLPKCLQLSIIKYFWILKSLSWLWLWILESGLHKLSSIHRHEAFEDVWVWVMGGLQCIYRVKRVHRICHSTMHLVTLWGCM